MNLHGEAELHYPLDETLPAIGEVFMLNEAVAWLRMPLPFALNHINLWLIRDGEAWVAVDCGIDSPVTRDAWQQIFDSGIRLSHILVTHCHPDHVGLAHWLCEKFGVSLSMSLGEYISARLMSANMEGTDHQSGINHFLRHGMSVEMAQKMQGRQNYYSSLVPNVPVSFKRLREGDEVTIGQYQWRTICGYGHSPEHIALYCESLKMLISGDMVLPRISTNISVFALEPEANPLQLYLDSLHYFDNLPADTLVLPSHGKPFIGLHKRIAQLREHHAQRLAEVERLCVTGQTAAEVVPHMFKRELDVHQFNFAVGEALAHLHLLWKKQKIRREMGTDLIIRFRTQ